jgi:phage shock protein A
MTERTATQLENIVALQRCELERLHREVDELRQKPDALDLERRLKRAQREMSRQKQRAEMWRKRAGG